MSTAIPPYQVATRRKHALQMQLANMRVFMNVQTKQFEAIQIYSLDGVCQGAITWRIMRRAPGNWTEDFL
jgi:hypothetical protein